jgi:hypothetical protein
VLTLTNRLILPYTRVASSRTCVPYVLFNVNARLFPKELSTCVCDRKHAKSVSTRTSENTRRCWLHRNIQEIQRLPAAFKRIEANLCCKMQDGVNFFSVQDMTDEISTLDVRLYELHIAAKQ